MLAGELHVSVAGQQFRIRGDANTLTVLVPRWRAAYALRVIPMPTRLLARGLRLGRLELRAQVADRPSFQLFPKTGLLVKLLSPSIRELNRESAELDGFARAFS